jgi:hypothetical protein
MTSSADSPHETLAIASETPRNVAHFHLCGEGSESGSVVWFIMPVQTPTGVPRMIPASREAMTREERMDLAGISIPCVPDQGLGFRARGRAPYAAMMNVMW